MPRIVNGTLNHGHSATAGDGGALDAGALAGLDPASMSSGAASDGDVLTADGSGGVAWEASSVPATVPNHDHTGDAGDGGNLTISGIGASPVAIVDGGTGAVDLWEAAENLGFSQRHGVYNPNYTDANLAFNDSTHIVSFPPGNAITYYLDGEYCNVSGVTCDLDDFKVGETLETGMWYIYFEDNTGQPVASQQPWTIDRSTVPLATVFWNGTTGAVSWEAHSALRNIEWHRTQHLTVGSMYQTGFNLTYPASGANYSSIQIGAGTIRDEDIVKTTSGNSTNCRLWYQTGASTYTFENSNRAHLWSGSAIQYINSSGYAKTAISGAQRAVTWIYASTDKDRCIYVFAETASAPYANLTAARAATPPNLVGFGLSNELKLLYRCIWSPTDLVETQDYRRSSALPVGGTSQVAAAAVVYVPTGQTAATNVQAAIDELRVQTGSIVRWPSVTIPTGYLECLGQAVSRTTYAHLFEAIGTTYGDGDGSSTFNLPRIYNRSALVPMQGTIRSWRGMCATPAGDIYAAVDSGDIYKRSGWDGAFVGLSQNSRQWWGMCAAPNGNIYASVYGGDIYMQTAGSGDFAALSQTNRNWMGMCATAGNDIYCAVSSGDIYMQTAGAGDFVALSQTNRMWAGMATSAAGNVYAACYNGDIYMQTAGVGDFAATGQVSRTWNGMSADANGDVYAVNGSSGAGNLWRQLNGTGPFVLLAGDPNQFRAGVCCAPNGSILVSIVSGDIEIGYTDRAIIKA